MLLNVGKCVVVAHGQEKSVSCGVSSNTVPTLQYYTYQGLPMTVDLNLNPLQDRKKETTNA